MILRINGKTTVTRAVGVDSSLGSTSSRAVEFRCRNRAEFSTFPRSRDTPFAKTEGYYSDVFIVYMGIFTEVSRRKVNIHDSFL